MLPQYITAIRSFTYDVALIRSGLSDIMDEVTDADILDVVSEYAHEDLGGDDYHLISGDTGEEL